MSGTRGGTGKPLYLKCSRCKKTRDQSGNARPGKLVRTGQEKPARSRGARSSRIAYECRCMDCDHVGWYEHADTERLPLDPKRAKDFEPWFLETLDSLRQLKRLAERHNEHNGGIRLWPGEILCLVDCGLSMLDRFDSDRAKRELLEHFRYSRKK